MGGKWYLHLLLVALETGWAINVENPQKSENTKSTISIYTTSCFVPKELGTL